MRHSDCRLPTLLDRLVEPNHGKRTDISKQAYQQSVLRDLQWLLATVAGGNHAALVGYEEVSRSVLNYGIPSSTGMAMTEKELIQLTQGIKAAILTYEPRIMPESLSITVLPERQARSRLTFKIHLTYWFDPHPLNLCVHALWDIESGLVSLQPV